SRSSKRSPIGARRRASDGPLLPDEPFDLFRDLRVLAALVRGVNEADGAGLVEDEARRHLRDLVLLHDAVILVPDDAELDAGLFDERLDLVLRLLLRVGRLVRLVDAHRDDGDVVAELIDELLIFRERLFARPAERRPEIEDDDLALR